MDQKLVLEIARIGLRYLAAYLMTKGVQQPFTDPLNDPQTLELVGGFIAAAVSEGGWIKAKMNKRKGAVRARAAARAEE